jgi:probable phosphoglycerate mutase
MLAGQALSVRTFTAVLVSPLQRARETAILAGLGDAQIREDLCEWDYGRYEGLTTAEIRRQRPGWLLWRDGVLDGETVEDVGHRADRVIAEVRGVPGDVALVGHGHQLRILAARWIELAAADGCHLYLNTATISVVGYEREIPAVLHWNIDTHLANTG